MTYEIPGFTRSYQTAGDLSASQYKAVKLSGATVVAVSAVGDRQIGVLQNKPAVAGAAATVMLSGVTRMIAAKAITAGSPVYLDATGQATDVATTASRIGFAESAASGAGKHISVLLMPQHNAA
jgi:hypothetical protein